MERARALAQAALLGAVAACAGGGGGAGGARGKGGQDGAGKADAGTEGRPPDGSEAVAVSFKKDIVPLLVASCGTATVGCHNRDQAVGRSMAQFGPCKVIWFSSANE